MRAQITIYFLFWSSQFAFFIFNFLASKQLTSTDFSIFVIVLAVIFFGIRFIDVGIGDFFVIEGNERDLSTLFLINTIKGIIIFFLFFVLSFKIDDFYNYHVLSKLIIVSAFIFVIESLKNPMIYKYYKEKKVTSVIVLEKGSYLISLLIGIYFMQKLSSIWILVYTYIFYFTTYTISSYLFFPCFKLEKIKISYLKKVLYFSAHIIFFIIITYFLRQGMDLVIPKLIGLDSFAIFSFTFLIGVSPANFLIYPFNKLIYPVYVSQIKQKNFSKLITNILINLLYLLSSLCLLIYFLSPYILEFFNHVSLFDKNLLVLTLFYGFVRGFTANLGTIYRSLDKQKIYNNILLLELLIIFLLLLVFNQNSLQIILVLIFSMLVHLFVGITSLKKDININIKKIFKNILITFIFCLFVCFLKLNFSYLPVLIVLLVFLFFLYKFFIFIKPFFMKNDV